MTENDKDLEQLLAELEGMPEEQASLLAGGAPSGHVPREEHMIQALEIAERGCLAGEPPVGACIVKDGEIITCLHNAVVS